MELGQAKAFGMLDDDHGRVRNIDTDFDDRSSDQNPDLAGPKIAHDRVALLRLHPAVRESNTKILEQGLAHLLSHLRSIPHLLKLLRRFDQRQDNESLMPAP